MANSENHSFSKYASVILEDALDLPLEYGIPKEMELSVKKGSQVKVPLRGSFRCGFVIDIKESPSYAKVLPLQALLSEDSIPKDLFELAEWMSKYYGCSFRHVLKKILPTVVRKDFSAKEQYFVTKAKSNEELRAACIELRASTPPQTRVLEALLLAKKGLFLTELMEKASVSKSPIESLEKKGLIALAKIQIDRSPLQDEEYFKTEAKELNTEQRTAFERIVFSLNNQTFQTHLLFGVTGSGKTEVYLQAIEKALTKDMGTILLVPEISLTAQTIERLYSRFDKRIAILHHRLSQGERYDEWHRLKEGKAKIAVGARSAIFSPVQRLGLIIVDEEHDTAYKQNESIPCYHARDVAVMRGKIANATVVLGTATPSLESYANAQSGKYILHKLSSRATSFGLPKVSIVDMKKEYEKAKGYTSFSEKLIEAIKERLEKGEQSLLFLNRRGYHTSLSCKECGHIFKCPHCDLALTFHRGEKTLSCHLCAFFLSPPPKNCLSCGRGEALKYKGVGTEQVEKALHFLFPEIRTLRIDGDTTKHKGSHEKLFRQFSTHKADVLIGTQMVSKGLHFPSVTLVSVLNCDSSLHIPDFRASEQVFQLLLQVAGRAGRGSIPGEVILQTQMPENSTIQLAAKQDFESFFHQECEIRKMFGFPPFSHFVKLVFVGKEATLVENSAREIREKLCNEMKKNAVVHPVIPSGHPKIKDLFYFQFLIRGLNVYKLNEAIKKVLSASPLPPTLKMRLDVDPLSTFF